MGFIERLRGGEAGPPVFAPRLTRLAARLEQVSPDRLEADPGALARTLHAAQRLLGLETIVLDGTRALTEACRPPTSSQGGRWRTFDPDVVVRSPRFALVGDAVAWLRSATPETTGSIVLLPGPWALAAGLGPGAPPTADALEAAGDACVGAARALAEARVAAVMVAEGRVPPGLLDEAAAGLRSVCTALRYYGVASVVCLANAGAAEGPLGDSAGADVVVVPAESPVRSSWGRGGRGLALPTAWFLATRTGDLAAVRDALAAFPGVRLMTTAAEIPEATAPESIREMLAIIRSVGS